MLQQRTQLKWAMLLVIGALSIILNVSQHLYGATLDARMSRQDKLNLVHINAKNMYNHYCAHCHGEEGKGDGRSFAYELEPKPRDFTDTEYMSKLKDDGIKQVIIGGSASVKKSNLCPAWGNTFSKKEINELVAYVRAFSVPPSKEEKPVEVAAPAAEEAEEETIGATPFIVWPILTLLSAFFIYMAIFEWRKT